MSNLEDKLTQGQRIRLEAVNLALAGNYEMPTRKLLDRAEAIAEFIKNGEDSHDGE